MSMTGDPSRNPIPPARRPSETPETLQDAVVGFLDDKHPLICESPEEAHEVSQLLESDHRYSTIVLTSDDQDLYSCEVHHSFKQVLILPVEEVEREDGSTDYNYQLERHIIETLPDWFSERLMAAMRSAQQEKERREQLLKRMKKVHDAQSQQVGAGHGAPNS